MGQANNSGRNASLDEHKARAAGRQKELGRDRGSRDNTETSKPPRGTTKGAFGRGGASGAKK